MCKLIRKLVCLVILTALIVFIIGLTKGGDPFRWFGRKSEKVGHILKEKSEKLADEADRLKKTGETIKKEAEEIKKTKEKIRNAIN